MKKTKLAVVAAVAVLGLGALGGVAVRANAADTPPGFRRDGAQHGR